MWQGCGTWKSGAARTFGSEEEERVVLIQCMVLCMDRSTNAMSTRCLHRSCDQKNRYSAGYGGGSLRTPVVNIIFQILHF